MNKSLIVAFVSFSLISSTCFSSDNILGTAYKHRTLFRDGYHDKSIGAEMFQVTFKGNSFTSKETAIRYALVRAAEVTKNNGGNYFVIVDKIDSSASSQSRIYSPLIFPFFKTNSIDNWVEYLSLHFMTSSSLESASFTLTIKTFKEKPSSDSYLNADEIIMANTDILKQRNK